jgi:hypothetical protein
MERSTLGTDCERQCDAHLRATAQGVRGRSRTTHAELLSALVEPPEGPAKAPKRGHSGAHRVRVARSAPRNRERSRLDWASTAPSSFSALCATSTGDLAGISPAIRQLKLAGIGGVRSIGARRVRCPLRHAEGTKHNRGEDEDGPTQRPSPPTGTVLRVALARVERRRPTVVAISPFRGKTHTRHQKSTHMRWIRWPDFPGIHCVQPVHKAVDNLCGTVVCSQPTSCPEFHPLSKKRQK